MIECGWCGRATPAGARCASCGHASPSLPWEQRGQEPPAAEGDMARRLAAARRRLGPRATAEALAEDLDVSARTVRRWLKASA